MISYVVASLALFGATVSAGSCGSAYVVNQCSYDVYLQNTPSYGGGYSQIDTVLKSGKNYTQEYTPLSNNNGWSMKISKTDGAFQSNILQYEYTYQTADTSIVWFDLSCVNGDPFDQDWLISADSPNGNCDPSQQPYTYPTEDKVVPEVSQSCSSDNTIILTLCHSNSNSGSSSGSASSSSAQTSQAVASSSAASSQAANTPASSSQAAASYSAPAILGSLADKAENGKGAAEYNWNNADASASEAAASPSPTTFATVITASPGEVIVTDVQTAIVTNIVTAYAGRVKPRHEHHAHGHAHHA